MCKSQVNPSEVQGVYEEWGWVSAKVYWVYVNEFKVNYMNVSLSEVSVSVSEAIQSKVRYCKGSSKLRYYLWLILYCEAKCELVFLK